MEKLAKMALLADFYGPLLTEKQRYVWDLHYQQDFSLTEIAEAENISRQAVHDLLKRTERILVGYEDKLGLIQRFWQEREKLLIVEGLLEKLATTVSEPELCRQLENIHNQIGEVLLGIDG